MSGRRRYATQRRTRLLGGGVLLLVVGMVAWELRGSEGTSVLHTVAVASNP